MKTAFKYETYNKIISFRWTHHEIKFPGLKHIMYEMFVNIDIAAMSTGTDKIKLPFA